MGQAAEESEETGFNKRPESSPESTETPDVIHSGIDHSLSVLLSASLGDLGKSSEPNQNDNELQSDT
jgi:hypothetical protein